MNDLRFLFDISAFIKMTVFLSGWLKMSLWKTYLQPVLLVMAMCCSSCKTDMPTSLVVNEREVFFEVEGGNIIIKVSTNDPQLIIKTEATWLKIIQSPLTNGHKEISISALENSTGKLRQTLVSISSVASTAIQLLYVSQKSNLYPTYNISPQPADVIGVSHTAMEISDKIVIGWNLGNNLEAIGGETSWGNPKITSELIEIVKKNGFNAIRLPCSWNQYADVGTAQIKTSWLNRVKDVVQMCVNNNIYVILNIHWDGGWLENNCTPEKQAENNAKQKALWQQIATHLRDFDEHLLFASANEPNIDNTVQMTVLNSYHQTFVDVVRATGGKNAYRILVIQGPSTDIEKTNKLFTNMPTDKVPNRLMAEVHYYTPWNFVGLTQDESWGKMFYYWGKDYHSITDIARNSTWGEEQTIHNNFEAMKKLFIDKGIPVVIGEMGAMRRTNLMGDALKLHTTARAYYLQYVVKQAKAYGLIPFYWDNGGLDNFASGIFNRKNYSIFDQIALDALMQGVTK
jgi:endoglucanase